MKCRDCKHYVPADERTGRCLKQRINDPVYGTVYGVAFANDGSPDPNDLDCDMGERKPEGGSRDD